MCERGADKHAEECHDSVCIAFPCQDALAQRASAEGAAPSPTVAMLRKFHPVGVSHRLPLKPQLEPAGDQVEGKRDHEDSRKPTEQMGIADEDQITYSTREAQPRTLSKSADYQAGNQRPEHRSVRRAGPLNLRR